MTHGRAIQTLGESITNVNEMLSELKDLVHQNIMPKIGESNVESVLRCNNRRTYRRGEYAYPLGGIHQHV